MSFPKLWSRSLQLSPTLKNRDYGLAILSRRPGPTISRRPITTTSSNRTEDVETKSESNANLPEAPSLVRALPASPSYFAQSPKFIESFVKLQHDLRKFGHLPTLPSEEVLRVTWKTFNEFKESIGERITKTVYGECLAIAKHLHNLRPDLLPERVRQTISTFMTTHNPFLNIAHPIRIDRFGRALGVGRRKSSTARAWVVEGTGEVIVNGRTLKEVFGRVHDRESAVWALKATDRMDKYNVWAIAQGGGTTGQAEALTLAVAKGLLAHEPALKPALRRAGCVTRDPRTVERKKHGHLKARKMPRWVRR